MPLTRPMHEGYLYVMRSTSLMLDKIGITRFPERRIEEVSCDHDPRIYVEYHRLFRLQRCDLIEAMLHDEFACKRRCGEWFELDDDDLAKLDKIMEAMGSKCLTHYMFSIDIARKV